MKKKIITVVGARPQFVKAAVVSRELRKHNTIEEKIIHTGQHFDSCMSDIFFKEMDIPVPSFSLGIHSLPHGAMTGRMLEQIENILISEKPDTVLVYGDTNTTLSAALSASKLNIPIAHVEAGLRSFNNTMPEETNRIITDRLSKWLFCPTDKSVENLAKEGIGEYNKANIIKCGDVMYDSALFYMDRSKIPNLDLPENYVICTVHRAENTDSKSKLLSIFNTLELINKDIPVVVPIHPRTKNLLLKYHYDIGKSNLTLIEPVSYLEMVYLLNNCKCVLTDSGGLQKESYFFGKYGIILREETEWIELIEHGYNFLCGTNEESIISSFKKIINRPKIDSNSNLYGNGKSGEKIAKTLIEL